MYTGNMWCPHCGNEQTDAGACLRCRTEVIEKPEAVCVLESENRKLVAQRRDIARQAQKLTDRVHEQQREIERLR